MFVMLSVHSLSSIGEDLQRAAQVQQTQIESKQRTDLIDPSSPPSSSSTITAAAATTTTATSRAFAINCPRGLWTSSKNSSNNSSQTSAGGEHQPTSQQQQKTRCSRGSAGFLARGAQGSSWSFNEEELNNNRSHLVHLPQRQSLASCAVLPNNNTKAAHDEPHPVATILNDLSPVPKVTNHNRSVVGATSHMSPPMTLKGWHSKSPDAKAMR